MKIKTIKMLALNFNYEIDTNYDMEDNIDLAIDALIEMLKVEEKKRKKIKKCGTPDDGGMLPAPPDLIIVD